MRSALRTAPESLRAHHLERLDPDLFNLFPKPAREQTVEPAPGPEHRHGYEHRGRAQGVEDVRRWRWHRRLGGSRRWPAETHGWMAASASSPRLLEARIGIDDGHDRAGARMIPVAPRRATTRSESTGIVVSAATAVSRSSMRRARSAAWQCDEAPRTVRSTVPSNSTGAVATSPSTCGTRRLRASSRPVHASVAIRMSVSSDVGAGDPSTGRSSSAGTARVQWSARRRHHQLHATLGCTRLGFGRFEKLVHRPPHVGFDASFHLLLRARVRDDAGQTGRDVLEQAFDPASIAGALEFRGQCRLDRAASS